MAGEAVSEHTPDSQEVTVTSVVCCLDSVVEIGHHVVYSVVTPLIVAVLIDTMAGEAVLEHTSDSQEEIVTTVVCFVVSVVCSVVPLVCFVVSVVCFIISVVEIGHHVVYSVVAPLTVTVAVETIAEEMDSVHTWDSQDVTVTKVVCSLVFVVVAGGNDEVISWLVVALVTGGNDEDEYVDFGDSEEIEEEEEAELAEPVSLSEEPEVELLVGMTDDLDDSESIEAEVVVEEMTGEEMTGEEVTREEVTREEVTEEEMTREEVSEEEITEEEITEVPLLG
jgi:hypothetical protein